MQWAFVLKNGEDKKKMMILQKEIMTMAEQKSVAKSSIDKCWALGHFLAAPNLAQVLGGARDVRDLCLCY